MKKQLSNWSKEVKKKMIDLDMDINDVAERMKWTRQYTGFRQLDTLKITYQIAGSRINSGFFDVQSCQVFEKILLYGLYGVVLCGIIRYETQL